MNTKGLFVVTLLGLALTGSAYGDSPSPEHPERKVVALSCEIQFESGPATKSLKSLLVEVPKLLLEEPSLVVKNVDYAPNPKKRGKAQRKMRLALESYGMSQGVGPKIKANIEHFELAPDGSYTSVAFGKGGSTKFDLSQADGLKWGITANSRKVPNAVVACGKVKTKASEALAASQKDAE